MPADWLAGGGPIHDERALSFAKFGVSQARRAWVEKHSVLNCLPWREFEEYLKSGK